MPEPKPVTLGTAFDASRILGVSPAAVRLMEQRGALSAVRTAGGVRLFNLEEVARLAAHRAAAK